MSVWSLTAAAVLTGLTVGAQQSPVPARIATPTPVIQVVAQREDSTQRVSVDFNHAAVSDVLDWLSKNGASFIAADSEIPKDATITMSIKDQPIDEVVDALASALRGHWERNGGVRVFRQGEESAFRGGAWAPPAPGQFRMAAPPGKMKVFKDGGKVFMSPDKANGNWKVFSGDDGKTFVMPDMKNFTVPDMKDMPNIDELRGQLKDMPGMSAEDIEKMKAEIKEQIKDSPARAEAIKQMRDAMKESQAAMQQSGEDMKVSRKAMEEARKAIEKARKEHPEAFGNGNSFYFSPGNEKEFLSPRNGKAFFTPGDGKDFKFMASPEGNSRFKVFGNGNFKKLLQSLSPEQKELNRRQGYLRPSDLTENQRKMLGVSSDAKGWTIKIAQDGDDVTFKSDR